MPRLSKIIGIIGFIGAGYAAYTGLEYVNNTNAARNNILNDTTISAQKYDEFTKRVDLGETTWIELDDSSKNSIKDAYQAQVDSVKKEIMKNRSISAKKMKAFKIEAGDNYAKWLEIADSLKRIKR